MCTRVGVITTDVLGLIIGMLNKFEDAFIIALVCKRWCWTRWNDTMKVKNIKVNILFNELIVSRELWGCGFTLYLLGGPTYESAVRTLGCHSINTLEDINGVIMQLRRDYHRFTYERARRFVFEKDKFQSVAQVKQNLCYRLKQVVYELKLNQEEHLQDVFRWNVKTEAPNRFLMISISLRFWLPDCQNLNQKAEKLWYPEVGVIHRISDDRKTLFKLLLCSDVGVGVFVRSYTNVFEQENLRRVPTPLGLNETILDPYGVICEKQDHGNVIRFAQNGDIVSRKNDQDVICHYYMHNVPKRYKKKGQICGIYDLESRINTLIRQGMCINKIYPSSRWFFQGPHIDGLKCLKCRTWYCSWKCSLRLNVNRCCSRKKNLLECSKSSGRCCGEILRVYEIFYDQ
jgi:hypothetical protein